MKDDNKSDSLTSRMMNDPYFFRPLYQSYANILEHVGNYPEETIHGSELFQFTPDHDVVRTVVAWGFLRAATRSELAEYEVGIVATDYNDTYRITKLAREFAELETSNISDLERGILILLRASVGGTTRSGWVRESLIEISFYGFVVIFNTSEERMLTVLQHLHSISLIKASISFHEGRVWDLFTKFEITDQGMLFLEKGVTVKYNNFNISNSNIGVIAIDSTLHEIDVTIGNLNQKGKVEIAKTFSSMTEEVMKSALSENEKGEVLQQVEVLGEQAAKSPAERKPAIVKGAMAFLEKALSVGANLATLWGTWGPAIRTYFGI